MTLEAQHDPTPTDDLSALSWVHEELRRTLEAAHKALRRHLREADSVLGSDVDAFDPSVLRQARAQLHQAVGVLEMVGLPAATTLLRASEAAVQKMVAKPAQVDRAAVEAIERASFALLDFVARKLAGKPVSGLALFPAYRTVQELAQAERVHPADLWTGAALPAELPADTQVEPMADDEAFRAAVEAQMLALLRNPRGSAGAAMSRLFAGLANGSADAPVATLWRLAAAFFEAQAQGLLPADIYGKRMAARLLAHLRLLERAPAAAETASAGERLRRDLLFFCAQGGPAADGVATPRLAAVRRACGLVGRPVEDYESARLGRFDPAWLVQARKRVAAAKDSWAAVAAGELHRLGALGEQFALVADSLRRLYAGGEVLADALQAAAADTVERAAAPAPALAMEVATGMLYLDAALEDADFDHPDQGERVRQLAQRIATVLSGGAAQPLESWMDELYRRVSDRQTMGSVVHELRAALAEAERPIDVYFRDAAQREALLQVPAQLQTMRGVLSVLGLDEAAQAVLRMRDDVDRLIAADETSAPDAAIVDRLAVNLGALGFLVDLLGVQPPLAKALFRYDRERGLLCTAGAAPVPAAARQASPVHEVAAASPQAALTAPALVESAPPAVPVPAADAGGVLPAIDAEMRDIFLEEAREVIGMARQALEALAATPDDLAALTSVRRAFHTLKGSARMVGLDDYGAAAWAFEQLYNTRLAEAPRVDEALGALTDEALAYLGDWADAIADGHDRGHRSQPLQQAADAMRLHGRREALSLPAAAAPAAEVSGSASGAGTAAPNAAATIGDAAAAAAFDLPAVDLEIAAGVEGLQADELPAAALGEFDLMFEPLPQALPGPATPAAVAMPTAEPLFELDLGELDELMAAEPMAVEPLPTPEAPTAAASVVEGASCDGLELEPTAATTSAAPAAAEAAEVPAAPQLPTEPEQYKTVGPLRVSIPLFNIYLNEADELSRRLVTELAEWAHARLRPVDDTTIAFAHSLAGSSATVGYDELSELARALEHALTRSQALGNGSDDEAVLFVQTAEEIRRLLHQFAAGFLPPVPPVLHERLAALEREATQRLQALAGRAETPDSQQLPFDVATMSGTVDAFALDVMPPADEVQVEAPVVRWPAAAEAALAPGEPHADVPAVATADDAYTAVEPPTAAEAAVPAAPLPDDVANAAATATPAAVDAQLPLSTLAGATAAPSHVLGPMPQPDLSRPPTAAPAMDVDDDIDAIDAVDAELFPIFEDEAQELLPQLSARMREWARRPADAGAAAACMRTLHTLKGGARLAGAMRLGELAHRLETAIEHALAGGHAGAADVERLQGRVDAIGAVFDSLRGGPPAATGTPAPAPAAMALPLPGEAPVEAAGRAGARPSQATAPIDWSRFAPVAATVPPAVEAAAGAASASAVRVRVPLLDRLVNHAGEVSITRSRIEADVDTLKASLADLTENLERLRRQLRDLELQAETQIASRIEQAKAAAQQFDPLEFDRFTRFQELTRMMAESVNDVATVQRSLQRALQSAEDELAAQARLTRDLQDDLLRTRMVEFEGLSDRLYRVVRQAAKETGRQVRLDIVGGTIEVDRGVLDRMTPAFEHLLRNCVTHGIESPEVRTAAGKDPAGQITVALTQEGNEVGVEFRDDGGGLNLARIRERGIALGLLAADAQPGDAELADLIFAPGFSTAERVTELAGRGVGMDVVRSDVAAMGGRIETATAAGQGTSFKLVLPLTTAVTRVVMLRCGATQVAVPATLVEAVKRVPAAELEQACVGGRFDYGGQPVPFFWLGALLDGGGRSGESARNAIIVVVRSAQQRVALHVDEVLGNQEVVVKNLGPQLSRLPGLAGVTLLPSGMPALIYNPVALAALYGERARAAARQAPACASAPEASAEVERAPLVLVVDDSLTVRRVTQRLLAREGYRVALAKDGLDALERLAEEKPAVVLSDIEMPRMDGFDLVRNLRGDARWHDLPVIMITSRIAQRHRDVAAELGVEHYLGKPYSEEELLALVARYAATAVPA